MPEQLERLAVSIPTLSTTDPDSLYEVALQRANELSTTPVVDLEYSQSEWLDGQLKLVTFTGLGTRDN